MRALLLLTLAARAAFADGRIPPLWRDGRTLGDKIELEEAHVCASGGHVLVIDRVDQLYYGDTKTLVVVLKLGGEGMFDPRQQNERAFAAWDSSAKKCVVKCGPRTLQLDPLPADDAAKLLVDARYVPSPHTRTPHALLRDANGVYYYVDRGRLPGEEKDFRLYVGRKGGLVLQKMVNVVSDSAGDIFTTKSGDLRLLVDKEQPSEWVERGKHTRLRLVPLDENLHVIYAELGVYAGQRLGNPCDDL